MPGQLGVSHPQRFEHRFGFVASALGVERPQAAARFTNVGGEIPAFDFELLAPIAISDEADTQRFDDIADEAMHTRTSLLPHVEIRPTPEPYGTDTVSAMRRGSFGLLCGGVAFHIAELRKHLSVDTVFVATGGGAATYAPWIPGLDRVAPHLTVHGIWAAFRQETA